MNPKFKIGDKVCITAIPCEQSIYLHSKQTIIDIIYYESSNEYYYILSDSFLHKNRIRFSKEQLNLVQTSEQIAVEKALKEFKDNIKQELNNRIELCNKFKYMGTKIDALVMKNKIVDYKEILKLLESEDR